MANSLETPRVAKTPINMQVPKQALTWLVCCSRAASLILEEGVLVFPSRSRTWVPSWYTQVMMNPEEKQKMNTPMTTTKSLRETHGNCSGTKATRLNTKVSRLERGALVVVVVVAVFEVV